jgi:TorA maturation chaperone TorD
LEKLVLAAQLMGAGAIRAEFDALFAGVGTPRINPYESVYLTGFTMEQPLAELRADLAQLGLARVPGASETEDHLGALCETMRLLIMGGQAIGLQREFFDKHIEPWYRNCLDDIRSVRDANFYRQLADFIDAFFDAEWQAFEIGETPASGKVA